MSGSPRLTADNAPMSMTAVPPAGPAPAADPPAATPRRPWWRLNYLGLVFALLGIALALTPSILPRPWLFEGLIAGIGAALFYGLGVLVSWVLRRPGREPSRGSKRIAWWVLAVGWPILFVLSVIAGGHAQNEVRRLVGEPESPAQHVLGIAAVCLGLALLLILAGRGVRGITRWIHRHLRRFIPHRIAWALAVGIVALLGYWLTAGVLFTTFVDVADAVYANENEGTADGVTAPTDPARSGSPQSLASWASLGAAGRNVVGRGPDAAAISAFTGAPAQTPIRVYVGVDTAPTAAERAQIAVAELERTGAFDRAVLVVAGATGTGWLEPQSLDSLEYMWGGDTAVATIQYSYLPSWISFLVDQDRATEAGRALFEAVYARWSQLPEATRPKLLAYGLSLGSFAGQAPFSGVQDLAARTDGALFMGTPSFSEPWGTITAGRDEGSPEWQPVYQQGATARFAATEGDLATPGGPWPDPHVVFMQHASDPVVWWSPNLLSRAPDWLREPRGPDVSPATRWYPIITFLQVTVDQFFGVSVPPGHGHNYGSTIVYAWGNVAAPPGWTPEKAAELQQLIDTLPVE